MKKLKTLFLSLVLILLVFTSVNATGFTKTDVSSAYVKEGDTIPVFQFTLTDGGDVTIAGTAPAAGTGLTANPSNHWTNLYFYDGGTLGTWEVGSDAIWTDDGNVYYDAGLDTSVSGVQTENTGPGSTSDPWSSSYYDGNTAGGSFETGSDWIGIDNDGDGVYTSAADLIVIDQSDAPTAGDTLYDVTTADNVCSDNSDLELATCVYTDTDGTPCDGTVGSGTYYLGTSCAQASDIQIISADNWATTDDVIDSTTDFIKENVAEELTYSAGADTTIAGTAPAAGTGLTANPSNHWTNLYFYDGGTLGTWEVGSDAIWTDDGNVYYDAGLDTSVSGVQTENTGPGSTSDPWSSSYYDGNTAGGSFETGSDWIGIDNDGNGFYKDLLEDLTIYNNGTANSTDISLTMYEGSGCSGVSTPLTFSASPDRWVVTGLGWAVNADTTYTICAQVQTGATNGATIQMQIKQYDITLQGLTLPTTDQTNANVQTIDTVAPTVVSVSSDGQTYTASTLSPVTITVTFSEDISNTPTISVSPDGGSQTVNDCGDADATTFCFDYTLPTTNLTTETITISGAQDLAGNVMSDDSTHTFDVDTVAPTVSSVSVSPSTGTAKIGDTINVTIDAGETGLTLGGACTINSVDVSGTFTDNGDNTYTLTYSVSEGDSDWTAGNLPINCVLQDSVGNTVTVNTFTDSNTLAGDANSPTVDDPSAIIGTTVEGGNDQIAITFSEDVQAEDGTWSNNEFSSIQMCTGVGTGCNALNLTGATFSYNSGTRTLTITLDESNAYLKNGMYLSVTPTSNTIMDLAGNYLGSTQVDGTTAISGDATLPTVSSVTVSHNPVNDATVGTQNITVVFSEGMEQGTNPTVVISGLSGGNIIVTGSWLNSTTWEGTFTISDNDEEVTATVNISGAEDLAGNVMNQDLTHTFNVDTLAPSFTINAIATDNIVNANEDDALTITTTAFAEGTTVSLIIQNSSAQVHTDSQSVSASQQASFNVGNISSWADGIYTVIITGVDAAGNNHTETTGFYKFTVPMNVINPLLTGVDTTQLNQIDDWSNIANLVFSTNFGKLQFQGPLDLTDSNTVNALFNLSNLFSMNATRVDLEATANTLSVLNTTTTITLYDYEDYGIANPMILMNGEVCPSTVCTNIDATQTNLGGNTSKKDITFTVQHWTTYEVQQSNSDVKLKYAYVVDSNFDGMPEQIKVEFDQNVEIIGSPAVTDVFELDTTTDADASFGTSPSLSASNNVVTITLGSGVNIDYRKLYGTDAGATAIRIKDAQTALVKAGTLVPIVWQTYEDIATGLVHITDGTAFSVPYCVNNTLIQQKLGQFSGSFVMYSDSLWNASTTFKPLRGYKYLGSSTFDMPVYTYETNCDVVPDSIKISVDNDWNLLGLDDVVKRYAADWLASLTLRSQVQTFIEQLLAADGSVLANYAVYNFTFNCSQVEPFQAYWIWYSGDDGHMFNGFESDQTTGTC